MPIDWESERDMARGVEENRDLYDALADDEPRGLTKVIADATDMTPEEIEAGAAEVDLRPPWKSPTLTDGGEIDQELVEAIAEVTGESVEEIRQQAEDFEIGPPWEGEIVEPTSEGR